MERLVLCVLVFGALVKGHSCPGRCLCQNISPTLTLLCGKTGLLFVPPTIDRKTVELRLTDNFITVIRRKDFFNMTNLVHLTLSRNTISQITPQAFMGLRSLRALHMDGNRLSTIKTEHFKGLVNLRHLILGNNQIHHVAPTSFDEFVSTIEHLDLSYNNLRTLPWESIARMTNINTLTLDHNLINHIEAGTFNLLTKLVRLDMTSNRLQKLPPDSLFQHAQVLSDSKGPYLTSLAVSFGGNPLHCNCELLWLRRLTREDDLETCASPEHLMDKYFWSIPEEEFICEPPLITTHQATKPYVMEGQGLSLKCKAMGDPDPVIHWHFPDGKLVHNNSRTVLYDNGTLEILITTLKDSGAFNCVASNAAGIANASVEVNMIPLPLFVNNTGHMKEADPGLSDITTSSKSNSNDTKNQDKRVVAVDLTSSSAVIRWPSERHIPGIRMYQIQYNSTSDDTLVYRRSFAVIWWTEGEDKGTFSEVKTHAIRNYDDSKMDEDGNPVKEYVAYIEWCQGRKKHNGCPIFQGIVVFVDNNRFNISRKMRELIRTPTLALHKCQHEPKRRFDDENGNSTDIETSEPPKTASQTPMTKAQMFLTKYRSETTDGRQTYLEDIAQLAEENIKLKKENLHLKKMLVKEIPGVITAIKNSVRTSSASSLDLSFRLSSSTSRPQTSDLQMPQMSRESTDEAFSAKIEIHPGTQVFCDKLAWATAVNASSLPVFVQTVLMSVFPVDVLLNSNLRGQIRGGRQKRELLDSNKIDAIFRAALTKWPDATPSQVGSIIKAKLNQLRNKKRQEDKQKERSKLLFEN